MNAHTFPSVVIAAAEELVRAGVAGALAGSYAVPASVGSIAACRQAFLRYRPRLAILVLDPPLAGGSIEEACATLVGAWRAPVALVLLRQPDGLRVQTAVRYGARAVFDTTLSVECLRDVLRKLEAGDAVVQPSLVGYLFERVVAGPAGPPAAAGLSPRQCAALKMVARGFTSKEIALALGSSAKAVDLSLGRAAQRLGAAHRAESVALAMRLGLLDEK
jgi:DNA-binding NarL/FixJ family response regulator